MTKTILKDDFFDLIREGGKQQDQLERSLPTRGWQLAAFFKSDGLTPSGFLAHATKPAPSYLRDKIGFMHLRGFIRLQAGSDSMGRPYSWTYGPFFYLPDGYSIEGEGRFVVATDTGPAQIILVTTTSALGVDSCSVVIDAAGHLPTSFLSLDGVNFLTNQKELVV